MRLQQIISRPARQAPRLVCMTAVAAGAALFAFAPVKAGRKVDHPRRLKSVPPALDVEIGS
jgi:hypothetical protein